MTSAEQSSDEYAECCICSDEFSNDTDLAAHLLEHAEDESYQTDPENNTNEGMGSQPGTPTKMAYPEYTKTSFVNSSSLINSVGSLGSAPEVCEIVNSEDEDDPGRREPLATLESSPNVLQTRVSSSNSPVMPRASPIMPRASPVMPRTNAINTTPIRRTLPVNTSPVQQRSPNFRMSVRQNLRGALNNVSVRNPVMQGVRPRNVTQMASPPFVCKLCAAVFNDAKLYREHLIGHEKPRPHPCHICNKTFAYKNTLRQHLRLHIGEKIHQCPACPRRFTFRAVLEKHCKEMHQLYTNAATTSTSVK